MSLIIKWEFDEIKQIGQTPAEVNYCQQGSNNHNYLNLPVNVFSKQIVLVFEVMLSI